MPQLTPVVLNDGAANRTFAPRDIKSNVASSVNRPGVAPSDAQVITRSLNGSESAGYKPLIKLTLPVVASVGGVPTVVDTIILQVSGRLPTKGTAADRTTALTLFKALLAHADTTAMFTTLEAIY